MIPDWVQKELANLGLSGAIIFVLLSALIAAVLYIQKLHSDRDKTYGHRLHERDNLMEALNNASTVLGKMLEATKERNELTEEQTQLIANQVHAFELLKQAVELQYKNLETHNKTAIDAVTVLASSVRALAEMVQESRYSHTVAVAEIKSLINACSDDVKREVRNSADHIVRSVR